ncbi:Nucleoside diphosphate kinase [Geodia barretti]|nr:Nucleoside diphosphate kinase [Geodia barretti]
MQVDEGLAHRHYGEHINRPFFAGLVSFITSGPVVAMAWEANNAVEIVRNTMGTTKPCQCRARDNSRRPRSRHRTQPDTWLGQSGIGRAGAFPILPA